MNIKLQVVKRKASKLVNKDHTSYHEFYLGLIVIVPKRWSLSLNINFLNVPRETLKWPLKHNISYVNFKLKTITLKIKIKYRAESRL